MRFWPSRKVPGDEPEHLITGRWGEDLGARHLQHLGMKILGKRVRVGKKDEIDVLARDGETLVFVEVKTRRSECFGRPITAVDRDKQYRLSRAALCYMNKLKHKPPYFRFDVIEVIGEPHNKYPEIRHIPNAFQLSKPFRVTW